jgi:dTDP-glucose 4,6-dehydratase
MSIMITGCAGFIGSHTAEVFLSAGYNVVGIDCMTYAADPKNMKDFIDKIDFYEVDIANTKEIAKIVRKHKVGWIVNFAAESHVDNSISSAQPFIHSNITGVYSLLSVCRSEGCKFFQISTDEVYGSIRDGSFVETDKLNPRNPYSATKAAAEHLVTSFYNTYGIDYKMVRMSNNFGPRQNKEKLIPTILRSLRAGKKIPIYGDGKNIRDWFYVKDCAKCILQVFRNGAINDVYNLSLVNEKENIEIVKSILKILQLPIYENIEFVKDRLGHDFRYSINNEKFLALYPMEQADFIESLTETVEEQSDE